MMSLRSPGLVLVVSIFAAIFCHYLDIKYIHDASEVISEIFVKLLKLISIPMVFLSIVVTLSGLDSKEELLGLGKKIALYTITTTVIAASISLCVYLFVDPSKGFHMPHTETQYQFQHYDKTNSSFVLDMIPSNLVQTFLESNVIGIVIIAFLIGISSFRIAAEKRQLLHNLFSALFDTMVQMSLMILKFLPLAVWAFVLILLKSYSVDNNASSLMWYLVCVGIANILQAFVVLPTLLMIKGISPAETFKGVLPALTTAFFSKSSSATIPYTLHCVQKNLNVSKRVSTFAIPMCSTINMNACSAFILITVLFVAEANGYVFSAFDFAMWIVLATLAAIGNAGVPMGCYFMSITYLIAMGVPINIMGLILPAYTIIDMFETAINVWSDVCITRVVDKRQANQSDM